MNTYLFSFFFVAQMMPAFNNGLALIIACLMIGGVAAVGFGAFKVIVQHDYHCIGYIVVGVIMAAASVAIINTTFAGAGTNGGTVLAPGHLD